MCAAVLSTEAKVPGCPIPGKHKPFRFTAKKSGAEHWAVFLAAQLPGYARPQAIPGRCWGVGGKPSCTQRMSPRPLPPAFPSHTVTRGDSAPGH